MKKLLIFLLTLLLSGAQLYSSPYSSGYGDSKKNSSSKNTLGCASAVLGMGVVNKCMPTGGKVTIKPRKDNGKVSWSSNLKGDVGEAIVNEMLPNSFDGRQNWSIITPRNRAQGFDHVVVRWQNGKVKGVQVVETKVNASKQSTTKSGVRQMSDSWIKERMPELSLQYGQAEKANIAGFNSKASKKAMICETPIKNPITGECEYFWSPDKGKTWYYTGDESTLKKARRQVGQKSQYFQAIVDGKEGIVYERVLCEVDLKSKNKTITMYSLDKDGEILKNAEGEKICEVKDLDLTNPVHETAVKDTYKSRLMENGLSEYEAERLVDNAEIEKIADGELFEKSIRKDVRKIRAIKSGVTVASAVIFDALLQVVMNHGFQNFSWKQSLVVAVFSTGMVGAEHTLRALPKIEWIKNVKLTNICKFVAKYSAEIVMVGVMLVELGIVVYKYRHGYISRSIMWKTIRNIGVIAGFAAVGAWLGNALGSAILPGIGNVLGEVLGGLIGSGLGYLVDRVCNYFSVKIERKNQREFVEELLFEQSLSNQTMRRRYYSYT